MKKRIGLIGFGFIGRYLLAKAEDDDLMEIDFVYDVDSQRTAELEPSSVLTDVSQLQQRHVDLVVEAAHPLAVRELGPQVLGQADLLIFSLTSLADDAFRKQMAERAEAANRCVYIPHGAVLGLDGLQNCLARLQCSRKRSLIGANSKAKNSRSSAFIPGAKSP